MAPRLDRHRRAPLAAVLGVAVVSGGTGAYLLTDMVVTLALQALHQLDAALEHDAPVHQDVHELGLHVVKMRW